MSQQQQKSVTRASDGRQKIDKLKKKIFRYIKDKETKRINDSETVCLLRRVFVACLKNAIVNIIIIDVILTLQSILTIMNKRLSRIEKKEMSKTNRVSYADVTIVERNSSAS